MVVSNVKMSGVHNDNELTFYLHIDTYMALCCSGYHLCTTSFNQAWTQALTKLCASSNPACDMLEIQNGKDLWQWSGLEIRLNAFSWSIILQKQLFSSSCKCQSNQQNSLVLLEKNVGLEERTVLTNCFIYFSFHYCSLVLMFSSKKPANKVENLQNNALSIVLVNYASLHGVLLEKSHKSTINLAQQSLLHIKAYNTLYGLNPRFLQESFKLQKTNRNNYDEYRKKHKYPCRKSSHLQH